MNEVNREWLKWEFVAIISESCIKKECKQRLAQCSGGPRDGIWHNYVLLPVNPKIGSLLSDYLSQEKKKRWDFNKKNREDRGICPYCGEEWQYTVLGVRRWNDVPDYISIYLPNCESIGGREND